MTADVSSKVSTDLFIGGNGVPASDGGRFDVLDPATGEVIASVADGTVDDGLAAVDAADARGPAGPRRRRGERAEILRRAFELMTERADEIATLISLENGKALADAQGEVDVRRRVLPLVRRGGGARRTAWSRPRRPARTGSWSLHQPVGVCVLVTPWNFPAAMATRKIGPALGGRLHRRPQAGAATPRSPRC